MKFHGLSRNFEKDLLALASAGGPDARELMGRLIPALEPIFQKQVIDLATTLAGEIAKELPHLAVEARLIDGGIEMTVNSTENFNLDSGSEQDARITLRLPTSLKERIEMTATGEGLSLNSWMLKTLQKNSYSPIVTGRQMRGRGQS